MNMDNESSYLFINDPSSFSADIEALFHPPPWPLEYENEMAVLGSLEVISKVPADATGVENMNGVSESDSSTQEYVNLSFADLGHAPSSSPRHPNFSDHSAVSWNLPTENNWDTNLLVGVNQTEITGLSSISDDLIMPDPDWNDNIRMDINDMSFVQEVEIEAEPESPNVLFENELFPMPEESQRCMKLRAPEQRVNTIHKLQNEFVVDSPTALPDKPALEKIPNRRVSAERKPRRPGIILCHDCGKYFTSTWTLKKHARTAHQQKSVKNLPIPNEALHLASKIIRTPKVVLERIPIPRTRHESRKLSALCTLCYKKFLSDDALRFHQIRVHKMKFRTPKHKPKPLCWKPKPEMCSSCNKVLSCKQSLKYHQIIVHKMKLDNYKRITALRAKQQECFVCGHKNTNIYHLRRHQKIAHKLNLPESRTVWKQLEPGAKKKFTRPSECYFNPVVVVENIQTPEASNRKPAKTINPLNQRMKPSVFERRKFANTKTRKWFQKCDICNEMVDGSLTTHKINAHSLALHNPTHKIIRQSVMCTLCSELMRKQYLIDHMESVHGASNQLFKRKSKRGNKQPANSDYKNSPVANCEGPHLKHNKLNPDLDESHIKWFQQKIKLADDKSRMYSHILETRCVVSLIDLKHTIEEVIPDEPHEKVIDPDPTVPEPEISKTTSRISSTTPAEDEDEGVALDPFFSPILEQIPSASSDDAGEASNNTEERTITAAKALDSPRNEDLAPQYSTASEIYEDSIGPELPESDESADTSQIPIDIQQEEPGAATLIIQETVRDLIEATANEIEFIENNEIIESVSLNATEIMNVDDFGDKANAESEGPDILDNSFETVVRIDDAGEDYLYLDAVGDEEAHNLEVVPEEQMGASVSQLLTLIRLPSSLSQETSGDSKLISKAADDKKLSKPNAWKVSVKDIKMRKLKCGVCKEMVEIGFFERHKKTDHILECHICLKPVHLSKTRRHGAMHVADRQCELCKYKSPTKARLWEHMNSHLRIRPLFCDICGKSFAAAANLSEHYSRKHVKASKYKCEFFTETFPASSHRSYHQRVQHSTTYI